MQYERPVITDFGSIGDHTFQTPGEGTKWTVQRPAIRTGLVDEYGLLVVPTTLGGGKRVLPTNVSVKLDLVDERCFANGMVYLRYHTRA